MQNDLNELFVLATRFFYKKYKQSGGSQGKLAEKLGITNSYLSSVASGSRKASLELQNQIANTLYGPYDKYLAIGRRIKEGREPLEEKKEDQPFDSVEKLLAQLTHYVLDHQRIERDLNLSQEKYRDISLTSGDMIFEMDANFRFIYLAGRVKEVTGRTPEEFLGKQFKDFLGKTEITRLQGLISDSIQNRTILDTVLTIHAEGEKKYRHLIAKPVFSPDGEFKGARGTCRDITKRKNLEIALEQQNWLLQVALDSVEHCAIVISDAHNHILKWNIEYRRMFNHSDKILKTRDSWKFIEETRGKVADPEQFDHDLKKAMQSKKETRHTFQLTDGRIIQRKVTPLYKNSTLVGRITHLKDITKAGTRLAD